MGGEAESLTEVRVPDIGDFEDVEVVEVLVTKGDRVALEDSLVSLESDKATMEIPSPVAGVVEEVHVALGDRVSEGSVLFSLRGTDASETDGPAATPEASPPRPAATPEPVAGEQAQSAEAAAPFVRPPVPEPERSASRADTRVRTRPPPLEHVPEPPPGRKGPHASPLVRRQARELGVDLTLAAGSGPSGRVLGEDVKRFVRESLSSGAGAGIAPAPVAKVDLSRFGPIESSALSKIRRVSARRLTQSWQQVPHVTQHDAADVTEIEAFRKARGPDAKARGLKLSPLLFVMKAVVVALREFPDFRASLDPSGESLTIKDYFHLGIAVDTEDGLVVPVVRDVDRKGVYALAAELAELAERARAKRLTPAEMQGACFTISSLGGIGGTHFTPIVNQPEVAILGLSKLEVVGRWTGGLDVADPDGRFEPRLSLPLSLSYDHRVIDGAVAARFTARLGALLAQPAGMLL